jgi:2-hydroxychromene-2-carboxylate isomerase
MTDIPYRTALIVGAGSGISASVARGLASAGLKVGLAARKWRAALFESGFYAGRFEELVQDPEVKARLLDDTQRSVARGTFGSPTFFVGDEIFFGKDRLRDVEEMILARR